ncbi:MAG: aminotransferase class V-fold PLP-dependent enzyme [Zavarzinella sp.]
MKTYRNYFPVCEKWAFFDHAAVCAPPSVCRDKIAEYSADLSENGIASFLKWHEQVIAARSTVGRLLNCAADDICFVGSTTQGIGIVAEGFPWQPGDEVITFAEEYPSNQYPWLNLQEKLVNVVNIPSRGNKIAIDDIMKAITPRTRVLAISSVEFGSGFRNDLVTISEICQKNQIFLFVDAIQSLGVQPIDLQSLPMDALAADSHKWLLGPEGAGIFYLKREWVERFHAIGVGWNSVVHPANFSSIDFRLKPHAGRFEGGTINVAGILGMAASMNLLLEVGIDSVWDKVNSLTQYFAEKIASAGWSVFSAREEPFRSGIVSIDYPGKDLKKVMATCRNEKIIVNVRSDRLRISPHFYNTIEELDHLIDVLRR